MSVPTYTIERSGDTVPGKYTSISGNTATAYGLIAAAEKAELELFLGSYPITPASDIMQELALRRDLGVKVMQCEDELQELLLLLELRMPDAWRLPVLPDRIGVEVRSNRFSCNG